MKKETDSGPTWKHMFLFTRDGKLQSTDLMYAFFLAVGILFLNFIISNRLTIIFENLFSELSRSGKNALGILIPTLLSALAAMLLFRIIRKKKIVLTAYCIALLLVIITFVILLFEFDRETLEVLAGAYAGIFVIPAAAGTAAAVFLFRRWSLRNPDTICEPEPVPEDEQSGQPEQSSEEDDISGWKQFRF